MVKRSQWFPFLKPSHITMNDKLWFCYYYMQVTKIVLKVFLECHVTDAMGNGYIASCFLSISVSLVGWTQVRVLYRLTFSCKMLLYQRSKRWTLFSNRGYYIFMRLLEWDIFLFVFFLFFFFFVNMMDLNFSNFFVVDGMKQQQLPVTWELSCDSTSIIIDDGIKKIRTQNLGTTLFVMSVWLNNEKKFYWTKSDNRCNNFYAWFI